MTTTAALWVKLDVDWPDNPKVITVGLAGAGLHASALCLSKRLATDGILWRTQLERLGATPDLIDALVEIGLFDSVDDRRVAVHNFLEHNPSAEEIEVSRSEASGRGRQGNHRRWQHRGSFEKCKICNPDGLPKPTSVAPSQPPIAPRSGSDSEPDRPPEGVGIPSLSPETETETEITTFPRRLRNSQATDRPDDDERPETDWRPEAALGILAQRDLDDRQCAADRPPVGDPEAWLSKAIERRRERHWADLERLARSAPGARDLTAEELADAVDPRVEVPDLAGEARDRQAALEAETAARSNGRPPRDDDRNRRGGAAARASMAEALAETGRRLDDPDSLHEEAPT